MTHLIANRAPRHLAAWSAIALLFAAILFYIPGTAPKASAAGGACTAGDTSAVTVVVDASGAGGGVSEYCAHVSPGTTGMRALQTAGIGVAGVSSQPGMICKLNGMPGNANCGSTPPRSAYWSYWHASNGGSWAYSSAGAANSRVIMGGLEGWSFGSGNPPAASTSLPSGGSNADGQANNDSNAGGGNNAGGAGAQAGAGANAGSQQQGNAATSGQNANNPTATNGSASPSGPAESGSASPSPDIASAQALSGASNPSARKSGPSAAVWAGIGAAVVLVGAIIGVTLYRRKQAQKLATSSDD